MVVALGNRGKCAGPCRLPFELLEVSNDDENSSKDLHSDFATSKKCNLSEKIDSGYLLSTRDLCGLDYIPFFIKAGVKCLKIEGRMKSPEYVAVVTRIYRKYIDLALSNKPYIVDKNDKKELMQVFNRGMMSSGHLDNEPNKSLVFKEKPNNMGLYLGIVQKYNKQKGHITLKLKETVEIGDTVSLENEEGSYTISELMENGKNISTTHVGQTIIIGRMKGNIKPGDKIYKMSSKALSSSARESYKTENIKIDLSCTVNIKKGKPISINVKSISNLDLYKNLNINCSLDCIPIDAKNKPLDTQTVINQLSKTTNTPYGFQNISINLDDNVFLPKLSSLNELRRMAIEKVQEFAINNISRNSLENLETASSNSTSIDENNQSINKGQMLDMEKSNQEKILNSMRTLNTKSTSNYSSKTSLLLNKLNENYNYSKLNYVDSLYIPLKYFTGRKYSNILKILSEKFEIYIYLPTIIKGNYKNLIYAHLENAVQKYDIKGFVISNIGNIKLLNDLFTDLDKYFKIVANYTFNVFNYRTVLELKKLGVSRFTISPELDKETITNLCNYSYLQKELIVYGKIPVLNMNYCLLRSI